MLGLSGCSALGPGKGAAGPDASVELHSEGEMHAWQQLPQTSGFAPHCRDLDRRQRVARATRVSWAAVPLFAFLLGFLLCCKLRDERWWCSGLRLEVTRYALEVCSDEA